MCLGLTKQYFYPQRAFVWRIQEFLGEIESNNSNKMGTEEAKFKWKCESKKRKLDKFVKGNRYKIMRKLPKKNLTIW